MVVEAEPRSTPSGGPLERGDSERRRRGGRARGQPCAPSEDPSAESQVNSHHDSVEDQAPATRMPALPVGESAASTKMMDSVSMSPRTPSAMATSGDIGGRRVCRARRAAMNAGVPGGP